MKKIDFGLVVNDLTEAAGLHRVWTRLAWRDARDQYRRTMIGPWWTTISSSVIIVILGVLYGRLLNQDMGGHLLYVSIGYVLWIYFSGLLINGSSIFLSNARYINQIPLVLTVYIFKYAAVELIKFVHTLPIVVVFIFMYAEDVTPQSIALSLLGFGAITLLGISFGMMLSVLCARYRDVVQLVVTGMRPFFFVTPIIWNANAFPGRAIYIDFNPFYHVIECVRAPIIDGRIPVTSLLVVMSMFLVVTVIAFGMYGKYKHRIPYWI